MENALITAIAVWTGWAVAEGEPFPLGIEPIILVISSVLILSGGNILNDMNDIEIDRRVHPKRPLPRGTFKPKTMIISVMVSWMVGMFLAAMVSYRQKEILPLVIIIFSVLLLLLYEEWSKKRGLLGNVNISLLTALTFIFGASLTGNVPVVVLLFSFMAFPLTVTRELYKDLEDMAADRTERNTFPMRSGKRSAVKLGRVTAVSGMILSVLPVFFIGPNPVYLVLVLVADNIFLFSLINPLSNIRRSSHLLKIGMGIALLAFFSWSII